VPKKKVDSQCSPDVAKLVEKLEDPDYSKFFLLTLELNKLESQYQKPDQPVLFLKEVDEIGIVTRAELNPLYVGKVPGFIPEHSFEAAAEAIAHFFNKTYYKRLSVMLSVNQIEKVFFEGIPKEERRKMPPFIDKQFDQFGFPTTYRLNADVQVERD
jgi:hypothetical protein